MAKKKGDIGIGFRMCEELLRIYGTTTKAAKALGCTRAMLNNWGRGNTPGGLYLAKLHYAKGDAIYVLTGKRSKIND